MKRKAYEVTERAGRYVAGQRRPANGLLMLTDSQAAYELALGTIRPVEPKAKSAPAAKRRRKRKAKD